MSSAAKIQSARVNGALSHGPVTAEGKQASSRNSTRHGLLSNTVVLESESKERFEELLSSLTAELQPRNIIESHLVETMAVARWRHLRVLSIQKAEIDLEMARQTVPESKPARAAIVFRNLADNSRVLDVLLRYEVAYDRQYARALNTLLNLRASTNKTGLPESMAKIQELPASAESGQGKAEIPKFRNKPNSPPAEPPVIEAGAPISETAPEETANLPCPCPSDVLMDNRRPYLVPNPSHKTIPVPVGIAHTAAAAA